MIHHYKIELIAIGLIVLMTGVSHIVTIKNENIEKKSSAKEIEIFDSVTIEANSSNITSILHADYTIKQFEEIKLTTVKYQGNGARDLTSNYGRTIKNKFYLDENITLIQDNGYIYKAEHAIYDKNIDFFYITSPFTGFIKKNIVKGINLKYDIVQKIATAEQIDAVFYTGKDR